MSEHEDDEKKSIDAVKIAFLKQTRQREASVDSELADIRNMMRVLVPGDDVAKWKLALRWVGLLRRQMAFKDIRELAELGADPAKRVRNASQKLQNASEEYRFWRLAFREEVVALKLRMAEMNRRDSCNYCECPVDKILMNRARTGAMSVRKKPPSTRD